MLRQALRKWGLAVAVTFGLLAGNAGVAGAWARGSGDPAAEVPQVALAALPEQAQDTYGKVLRGGPFPYAKDGGVFGNRERRLPSKARGYYREYTVKTPGAKDRGARRIICGGTQPTAPDTCFYTADHYTSFRRIAP